MNNCINKVTDGLENQAAIVSDWWKEAAAGVVDTTSSVWKGVCNWFTGTREQTYNITVGAVQNVKAGEKVNWINYGLGSTYATADKDCSCVEFWYKKGADIQYMLGRFWFSDSQAWITLRFKDGSGTTRSLSYSKDLNFYYYYDATMLTKGDDWKNVITTYLPNAYFFGEYAIDSGIELADFLQKARSLINERVCGGIDAAINDKTIEDAADVIWPDAITLNSDINVDGALEKILEKVVNGEMTWTEYLEKVASGTRVGVKTAEGVYTLDDAGVTDVPYEKDATDAPPAADTDTALNDSLADYKTEGLTSLFPFCIPFDLINCIRLLVATGEAPCWVFPFRVPVIGIEDSITIDLAKWDSVAALSRSIETLLFIGLLISRTREFIRG